MSRGRWNFIKRGALSNIFFMLSDLDVECNDGMYFSPSEGNLTKNPEDYFKYQKRKKNIRIITELCAIPMLHLGRDILANCEFWRLESSIG